MRPPYTNVNVSATYMKQKSLLYPVNVARNIARDSALTHFVLPSDIELYPSPNLVPRFLNMIARNAKPLNTSTKPRVFPISIFEVHENGPVSFLTNKLITFIYFYWYAIRSTIPGLVLTGPRGRFMTLTNTIASSTLKNLSFGDFWYFSFNKIQTIWS